MRATRLTCLALILLSGCSTHPSPDTSSSAGPKPDANTEPRLAERIPALLEEAGVPGLQIAVLEAGQLAWSAEYGQRDLSTGLPVEADTVFQAASLSKPVLAYLVLKMAESGKLDLDQPLYELLPYERFADLERARRLTPRLVLSHRTGLPNWGGDPLEFRFDPGARFGYSGEGYLYLQRVIEELSGQTLEQLAQREVFAPLGMQNSRFTWEEDRAPALATGHEADGKPVPARRPQANAASSLHTTARDYARFLSALLSGDGLAKDSLGLFFQPAVTMQGDERGAQDSAKLRGKVGWGLGWGTQEHRGQQTAWHWGDNGVFRAFVALQPSDGKGVVYFANSINGLAIAQQLIEPVVGDMSPTIEWLDYRQLSDPTFAPRRQGVLAESAGDYEAAIQHFRAVLALEPEDESVARRRQWLGDLLRVRSTPVSVASDQLRRYVGQYGPRRLYLEGGALYYQREGRDAYLLIPLSHSLFALDGMVDFRLEVVSDEQGSPLKLVGHYLGGQRDESLRTDDSTADP